jgi:hypothetical protein
MAEGRAGAALACRLYAGHDTAEFEEWLSSANEATRKGMTPQWCGGWAEGPFDRDHLESKLVGAVIGIFKPSRAVDKSNNGENDG